jgi:choline dehydrogenase-like flavoprotein
MNAMLYVRGRPLDYDLWEAQGAEGWGWEGVRPYFLKAENNERGASEHHAVGGPLNVANTRSPRKLTPLFLESAAAAGIPRVSDYNGPEQDGASWVQVTQKDGKRFSAADAYLKPARKRPNLEVITHAQVLRVELEGTRRPACATATRRATSRSRAPPARSCSPRAPTGRRSC